MTQAMAAFGVSTGLGRFGRRILGICPAQRACAATEAIALRSAGVRDSALLRASSAAASLAIGRMVANIYMLAQETACNLAMLALGF